MKKLLLGIVLVAALVAVSYIKVVRDSAQEAEAFQRREKSADNRTTQIVATADSLAILVAQQDSQLMVLTDSMCEQDLTQTRLSDSLGGIITSRDKELAELRAKAKAAPKTEVAATRQSKSSDHEVLAHYSQAVNKLPGDLSPYERAVAIREIRQETIQKFAITEDRLNQIRSNNNLDY